MSITRVPANTPGSYPAPGLTLTPGHTRNHALIVVGTPLLLILLLVVLLRTAGDDNSGSTYSGGYGGLGDGTVGGTVVPGDPDATSDEGVTPDGSTSGLGGESTPGYDSTWTDQPTDDPYSDPYSDPTDTATDTSAATGEAEATVRAYFEAINAREYSTAWELGGKNFDPDYDHFVAGLESTERDEITVTGTAGDDVSVTVVAWQTDGSWLTYEGTYTVQDGVITSADIEETG